jgi:hypothetical protein
VHRAGWPRNEAGLAGPRWTPPGLLAATIVALAAVVGPVSRADARGISPHIHPVSSLRRRGQTKQATVRRSWILISLIALPLVTSTAAVAAPRSHGAAAKPCQATIVTVRGHIGMKFCGPATAKVTVRGHTYSFTGGFCAADVDHKLALQLSLGWDIPAVSGKPNLGKPLFDLGLPTSHETGTLRTLDVGGAKVLANDTAIQGVWSGSAALKGTFHGTGVSGSWNCGGEIYKLDQG